MAAAILSVGLTAILTATSRCLAVISRSREYQEAQWALNRGIAENPFFLAEDIREQEVDAEEYDGYVFSRQVEDDEDEDGLFLVRSRVTWVRREREFVEEVVQYVYQVLEDVE